MALINLTVESIRYKNLSSTLTMGFDIGRIDNLTDIKSHLPVLNGNTQFLYTSIDGREEFYTVTQSVASIVAAGSASSVSGTTSESFSIDNDAVAYVLLKNNAGDLQLRNQDDTAYVDLTLATATFYLAAADTITIDAATTDHTGSSCMTFDVDINASACNIINQTIDIATALTADSVKGIYTDIDDIAASTDGSSMYGHDVIITSVSTSRSDAYGFKVAFDGTRDGNDEAIGLLVNADSLTINSASATLRGVEVDFSGTTDTDYLTNGFEGVKVTMPATYQGTDTASAFSAAGAGATVKILSGAATIYGADFTLDAATQAINIDASSTGHTTGDIIYASIDSNASAINFIHTEFYAGAALTADILRGLYFDMDDIAASTNGSGIYGADMLITGVSTSAADLIGYKVEFDGTQDQGDFAYGLFVDLNLTLNNVAEVCYGVHIDSAGVTNTSSAELAGIKFTLGASTQAINIDAATTDKTVGDIIYADIDVNSASVNFIHADFDIGVALSGGEIARGIYLDIDDIAASANTSGIYGVDLLLTAVSTSAADLIGYKVTFDGTADQGDYAWGVGIDANLTLNNAGQVFYGVLVDTTDVTNTLSSELAGAKFVLGASSQAINIDAATTDKTVGDIIYADIDVNSASVNFIHADLDIATALSGAETVRGIYFDMDSVAADADGSFFIGMEIQMTGISTSRADFIGYRVDFDGTRDTDDAVIGYLVNGDSLTVNSASATLRGVEVDFSGTTDTDYLTDGFEGVKVTMPATYQGTDTASAFSAAGAGATVKVLSGGAAIYGIGMVLAADTTAINIDAAATDHTAGDIIYADIDVNSASVNFIHADIDSAVALSGAEYVRGVYLDIDSLAADADTSGMYGVDVVMTAASTSRADLMGIRVTLDGTHDTDDLMKGAYFDGGTLTLNSASAQLHGVVVEFASVVDTDYLTNGFEGIRVNMPATYQGTDVASAFSASGAGATAKILSGAATIYGLDLTLAAATVGINIDAGTTDHTGSDIIVCNLDVNSASCNFIGADIDVGTALSAAEVVNGVSIDIDGNAADDGTSQLNGFYTTNGGTSTGITTSLRTAGTWDTGIDLSGATNTTDIILSNSATIHNTDANTLTFTEAGFNFVGNSTFNGAGGITFGVGGGVADVQTVTCTPAITAYVTGMGIAWRPVADNTGACTINVNAVGAKSIKTQSGADPAAADLDATTGIALAIYDGTNFVLINPATTCD